MQVQVKLFVNLRKNRFQNIELPDVSADLTKEGDFALKQSQV